MPRLDQNSPAPFFLIALASVSLLAACGPQGIADSSSDTTLVAVSASAEIKRTPDLAVLTTGVVSRGADAKAAIALNSKEMASVVNAVTAAGIELKDIQTSGVSINPDYAYVANRPPRINGYYASNTVNITVREISALGTILDALIAVGANQVNGPMFDIADKDAVLDEARGMALVKARKRADLYAEHLGLRVTRVVSVDETRGRAPIGVAYARGTVVEQAATDASANVPIAPGENTLSLALDVVYELAE
ncbi:SIMPL domain-containing protein [Luteimonas sp. A611]